MNMDRRKFLLGAGSTAIGMSAIIGSGAISSITADRDVDLAIAADSNGYLGLEAGDSPYVREEDGLIVFDFDDTQGVAGDGLNNRADTTLGDAFAIRNNSDRELNVWASFTDPDGNAIDPTSGAARSVELLVAGRDITYPHYEDKGGEPETSRVLEQTVDAGHVPFGQGRREPVEMRFLVYGSDDPRDSPFRIVFHASEEEPEAGDWNVDANGRP